MSDKNISVTVGPGLSGCMFLVFMVLKLLGKITWSWFWVCAPLWIPFSFVMCVLLLIFLGLLIKNLAS